MEHRGELENVLERYHQVFQEPQGLPSGREMKHRIALKEGAGPINVRPYRCTPFSKRGNREASRGNVENRDHSTKY